MSTTPESQASESVQDAPQAPLAASTPAEESSPQPESPSAADAVLVSLITAAGHKIVTKMFWQFGDEVRKTTFADLYEGDVEWRDVRSLAGLADLLQSLKTDQCLAFGIPPRRQVKLITERKYVELGRPATHVARTKGAFSWPAGPGVLMLDYDNPRDGSAPLDRDSLVVNAG